VSEINDNSKVLAVKLDYLQAAIDEMRQEDLPLIKREIKDIIFAEIAPINHRISRLEKGQTAVVAEVRILDKRVWLLFGAAGLVVPATVGALITVAVAYVSSGF